MGKRPIAAKKALDELRRSPEFLPRQRERDALRAKEVDVLRADEKELVLEIRELGYDVSSVWDLVNNEPHTLLHRRFVGPYELAYPTLARHHGQ